MYYKIRSKFIKDKIKGIKWNVKNRKYIGDLMNIELIVLGEYTSTGTSYIDLHLKETYPKEYEAIYKELDPQTYEKIIKKELKELKKEKQEEKRYREEERIAEKKEKEEWLKAGGVL